MSLSKSLGGLGAKLGVDIATSHVVGKIGDALEIDKKSVLPRVLISFALAGAAAVISSEFARAITNAIDPAPEPEPEPTEEN